MTAYLLVENQGRELASRLLIAKALVERGVQVVVGHQKAIVSALDSRPAGVVLHKGINRIVRRWIEARPRHVHVAIEEEAFGISDFGHASRGHDPATAVRELYVDSFATEYGRTYHAILTGNPRADLCAMPCMWEGEAARIRAEYGRFALLDTNTGIVNSRLGGIGEAVEVMRRVGWRQDVRDLAPVIASHARNMTNVVRLACDLADRGIRVVLRPHPSERADTWGRLLEGRAAVVTEGWHLPWIAAAAVTVHTGCTTGYEAALMGRPTAALLDDGEFEWHMASQINRTPPAQALDTVLGILAGDGYHHEVDVPQAGAHDRIADRIAALDPGPSSLAPVATLKQRTDYDRHKMSATRSEVAALWGRMGGQGRVVVVGEHVFGFEGRQRGSDGR